MYRCLPRTFSKEETTLVSNEQIQRLSDESLTRFGKLHKTPAVSAITFEEMRDKFLEQYPITVILEAMRRTASVIKKDPALEHHRVVRAVQNIADRLLVEAHSHGKNLRFKGRGQDAPTATPEPKTLAKSDIEHLLDCFQANCAEGGDWTLLEDTATDLLKQYGLGTIRETLLSLGRFDSDHAQDALDLLHFRLATTEMAIR